MAKHIKTQVDFDRLDTYYSGDGSPVEVWDGAALTDTVYYYRLDDPSVLEMEQTYVNGVETGPCREWYADGTLKSEVWMKYGTAHGGYKYWDSTGALVEEGTHIAGYKERYKKYGPGGVLELDYFWPHDPDESVRESIELQIEIWSLAGLNPAEMDGI